MAPQSLESQEEDLLEFDDVDEEYEANDTRGLYDSFCASRNKHEQ